MRSRVMSRGRIKDVAAAAGIDLRSLYRFFDGAEPESLRIEHYNRQLAAKAAGFGTWEELDSAWRKTPVVPVERRSTKPAATVADSVSQIVTALRALSSDKVREVGEQLPLTIASALFDAASDANSTLTHATTAKAAAARTSKTGQRLPPAPGRSNTKG